LRQRAKLAALAGGICIAVIAPAAAHASTKTVFMGTPPSAQRTFQNAGIDANDFFPHGITVHVGDTVEFVPAGFHTVDIPPRAARVLPLIMPNGQKIAGSNDAAGNPFWFNGQDQLGFNPALANPAASLYGKTVTYNGRSRVESGLPLGEKLEPVSVKFTRKGTFTYHCDVHPGMKGKVHVVAKRAKAPSKRADAKVVKRMIARDLAIGKQLATKNVPAGTVDVGEAGAFGVEFFGFLPRNLTVAPGTTIKFQLTQGSFETHTATTGPGNPDSEPDSYLGQLAKSFEAPTIDPRAAYPSDAPGTPASLTPQLHGNGFWNAGAMDNVPFTPLPSNNSVTFSAPGTYEFYCLIHPFMRGTVTVAG
jgi:plastocyanin